LSDHPSSVLRGTSGKTQAVPFSFKCRRVVAVLVLVLKLHFGIKFSYSFTGIFILFFTGRLSHAGFYIADALFLSGS